MIRIVGSVEGNSPLIAQAREDKPDKGVVGEMRLG